MPRPEPIPPDLWCRVAALDRRCDVSMVRRSEWQHIGAGGAKSWSQMPPPHPGSPHRRSWYVRVNLREGNVYEMVHVSDLALADALRTAVAQAEGRGWSDPDARR